MRSAKSLSAVGLLATAGVVLAGCTSPAAEPESDIELRMTVWTSSEEHLALFNGIADEYMSDNPEVTKVTFDPRPGADYTTTLTTQVGGGQAPDLAWILENSAPDFVASGALAPIEETLAATEGYEFDDLNESATALWKSDGKLAAYPFSTSPFVVFANDDLLKKAGQPSAAELIADGKWNWEGLSEVGAAVNKKTGKAGFVIRDFEYVTWDNLAAVWMGWGAAPWSEDGTQCTFNSPEMADAFEFLHEAAFDKKSMPGPGTTADFFAGESAFTVTQISRASLLAEAGFAWDLLPLPEGPAGDYSMVGQAGIGVMAQGKHKDAAAEFLAFFTNPENSEKLAQYFPPARNAQLNAETLAAANPVLSSDQIADVVVPGISTGVVRPSHTNSAEIGQQVRSALDAMWVADADIPTVLDSVCDAAEPLLAK